MNIFVGNLSFETRDDGLREAFSQYGSVDTAQVVMDRESGRSRGFGFVEMPDSGEAAAAINALNTAELNGRQLTVNEAKPRAPRNNNGGGGARW